MGVPRTLVRALAVAATLGVGLAQLDALDPCGARCYDQMVQAAAGLGCAEGDMACLCSKPDFGFGARDCAIQSCGAEFATPMDQFVSVMCTSPDTPPPPPPPPPPSTTEPPPGEGADNNTEPPAEAVSETQPTTAPTDPPASRPRPGQAPQSTIEDPAPSETAPPTNEPAPTTTPDDDDDDDDSSAEESKETADDSDAEAQDEDETPQATGFAALSLSAKAGIGVSIAFVFVVLVSLAALLIYRHRAKKNRDKRRRDYHISHPLPGSGRDFGDSSSEIKPYSMSELETRSRRYEDMLPRTQPNMF